MANGRYVSYLRVSTQKQGASGLGIEAQRKAVADYRPSQGVPASCLAINHSSYRLMRGVNGSWIGAGT